MGRPPGVERTPYGRGGEAVDGRLPPRLDVGTRWRSRARSRVSGPGATAVRSARTTWSTSAGQQRSEQRTGVVAGRPVCMRTTRARPDGGDASRSPTRRAPPRPGRRARVGAGAAARTAGRRPRQGRYRSRRRGRVGALGARPAPSSASPGPPDWSARGPGRCASCPHRRACRPGAAGARCRARPGRAASSDPPPARRTRCRRPRSASQAGLPSMSGQVARSPAAAATSTTSAVVGSSSWANSRATSRSRTAKARRCGEPPEGACPSGRAGQPTRRTASKAAPAAAWSTCVAPRCEVAISGGTSIGSRVVWPPRNAICTSPGTRTSRGRPGTSSPRDGKLLGRTRGLGGRDHPPPPSLRRPHRTTVSTCSSIARAAGDSWVNRGRDLSLRPTRCDRVQGRERPERLGHTGERAQPRVALPDQGQTGESSYGALDSG